MVANTGAALFTRCIAADGLYGGGEYCGKRGDGEGEGEGEDDVVVVPNGGGGGGAGDGSNV